MASSNPFLQTIERATGIAHGEVNVLSGITATTTTDAIDVREFHRLSLVFTEGGTVSNRSGVFTVTISNDGTNFYAYNMLISNATNTNGQTLTRVASVTRNTAGTDVVFITPETYFAYIKVTVTLTDGETPTGNFTVTLAGQS